MAHPKLTILVTGSNQGLGFEAARHLSKYSHVHLFVSGRNPPLVQEAVLKLKTEEGCQALIDSVILDISDDASIHAAVREVETKLKDAALDVLVNNAAIFLEKDVGDETLRGAFEKTFTTNTFGVAVTADAFLPLLKRSTARPRIINVGSGAGSCKRTSDPKYPFQLMVYGSSKAALNSITVTLAMKNPEIHVVVLCPGQNATNFSRLSGQDPRDGSKIIVEYALQVKGNSPGYYNAQGELPW